MSGGKQRNKAGYTVRNKVKLIRGGKQYFDLLLRMINNATESIHLQTYIYDDDETGQQVAAALKAAVKRKVEVYLLTDGYASKVMSTAFISGLVEAGIHFRFFNPLFKSKRFYLGRRLHHKVVVTDTKYALVGGVNISDRYNDMPGKPAWLDFALYVEGEAARELCILCWKTWKNYPMNMGLTPCELKEISYDDIPDGGSCEVSMRRNDWVRRKNEISSTYVEMLRTAQSDIVILCSYFLPGGFIRKQLSYAAKRGVKIKVIAAGMSDVKLAKYAERYMYSWLLRHNIELYEYQLNILHGKIAVCDGRWMTIGSYNINNISAYASIELNMNVRDTLMAAETEKTLLRIAEEDCIKVTKEYYLHTNNVFKQFSRWFSYQFIRTVFYLFTFYFKHMR
ncbi:MAG: phospholipase [Chitinophagaceae bacterium]|nr:phospholipase [Chitinophagaceae bacterium]